jgi:hypothetical protein
MFNHTMYYITFLFLQMVSFLTVFTVLFYEFPQVFP